MVHYYPLYLAYAFLIVSILFIGLWLSLYYDLYTWTRTFDGLTVEINTPLAILLIYPIYNCLILAMAGPYVSSGHAVHLVGPV